MSLIKINPEKFKDIVFQKIDQKLSELLSPTDWIIVKIHEAQLRGDNSLTNKYQKELRFRENIRQKMQELKERLREAKSIEEIRQIQKEVEDFGCFQEDSS